MLTGQAEQHRTKEKCSKNKLQLSFCLFFFFLLKPHLVPNTDEHKGKGDVVSTTE